MSRDLGPLRRAMSDLAEHGGSTDLYERSLRKSRQTQRRAAVTTGAAAAAVVFAIGGAVAFATDNQPAPSPPVATQPPAPSVSPTTAAPSATPSTTRPSSTPPVTTPTTNRAQDPGCPSAKTLERLVDLPKDWYFGQSSVHCWQGWATAEPEGPNLGDGVYLFRYKTGTGWRYHSQGSGYHCADLGTTSGNPPFCQMD